MVVNKNFIFIFVFTTLFLISGFTRVTLAQSIGDQVIINPADGYEFTGQASGPLVWPEGKAQVIILNLTLSFVPDNSSRIEVPLITYDYIGEIVNQDQIIDQRSKTLEIELSPSNKSISVNQSLLAPSTADRFYFNITLFSRSVGNITQGQPNPYVIRFPDSGTILVDRDRLVPLINLYGFPPESFFQKWLPLYGSLLFLLTMPAIIVGISKLTTRLESKDIEHISESDENNE